jgi:alpha-L-fucosidase
MNSPSKDQDRLNTARQSFLDLEFGMFIHFGLYSQGMEHEWHMYNHKMSLPDYKAQFLSTFDPDPKGIEQWVITAKEMGAKYLVCTSKHCDGFCLWDTKALHPMDPDYNIRNTPFYQKHGKSVLDVLFEAGKKHGIRIGIYHAIIDWSWSKKRWRNAPSHTIKNNKLREHFIENLKARLGELLRLYPDTLLFWFDGHVFYKDGYNVLKCEEIYNHLHSIKPEILVGFNFGGTNKLKLIGKSDFLIFENMAHFGESNPVLWPRSDPHQLPAEVCLTINNHWGYNAKDKKYKNTAMIAKLIRENVKRRGNTLLNYGPMPTGYIADDQVELAREIGKLLNPAE